MEVRGRHLSFGLTAAILFAVAWLFYSPVIEVDMVFQDDATRAIWQRDDHNFARNGRFSNEGLSHLMSSFDSSPVAEETLRSIISSPFHAQLVARDETGTIIGIATLSLTLGAGSKRNAWMEDFIVSPEAQGKGVGTSLWNAALSWFQTKDAKKLNFTSRPSREAAQAFYLKRGARIRETNYFTKAL